jgi:hypothetical protein
VVKTLDTFDFLAIPSANLALARCEFLSRKENVLLLGNSGTKPISRWLSAWPLASAATACASPLPQHWSLRFQKSPTNRASCLCFTPAKWFPFTPAWGPAATSRAFDATLLSLSSSTAS